MSKYRRVAWEDRCQIRAWIAAEKSIREIAQELEFDPSTIYREIRRNSGEKGYRPRQAQAKAQERYKRCRKKPLLQCELEQTVREKLALRWSPEQISGRLKRERKTPVVSHETIYRYIRARPEQKLLWKGCLRRYKKPGAGRISSRNQRPEWMIPISRRPKSVQNRRIFGHWERDTMQAAERKLMLVCAERKSKYLKLDRVKEPRSIYLAQQTQKLLDPSTLPRPLRSITNDNGGELKDGFLFSVPVYYCDPQKPQQRGTVENTIGLLRQYIPRSTDLQGLTEQEIQDIEQALNHRPRKCLDYRTPYEVFFGQTVALAS